MRVWRPAALWSHNKCPLWYGWLCGVVVPVVRVQCTGTTGDDDQSQAHKSPTTNATAAADAARPMLLRMQPASTYCYAVNSVHCMWTAQHAQRLLSMRCEYFMNLTPPMHGGIRCVFAMSRICAHLGAQVLLIDYVVAEVAICCLCVRVDGMA